MESFSEKNFKLINPHFFQPLLPGFHFNFSIPEAFLKKYLGNEIGEKINGKVAKLRTNKKVDDYDKYWMVKVDFDDNKLFLKEGWQKFCDDHGLEVGDFLVFRHHQNLAFDVFAFDSSGCERPFSSDHHQPTKSLYNNDSSAKNQFKGLKAVVEEEACLEAKMVGFTPRGYPYCYTTVKPYCLKWGGMPLPLKFARENDLADKRCEITVIDEIGEEYQLSLRYHKQGTCAYIGRWRDFHIKHRLKPHDPVVFEVIASGETPKLKFYGGCSGSSVDDDEVHIIDVENQFEDDELEPSVDHIPPPATSSGTPPTTSNRGGGGGGDGVSSVAKTSGVDEALLKEIQEIVTSAITTCQETIINKINHHFSTT